MFIALIVAIVEALTFTLAVAHSGSFITLRYPQGVEWVEACIETDGVDAHIDRDELWYTLSCWTPRFSVEDYPLRLGAKHVKGHLLIETDGERKTLHTAVVQVSPE